MVGWLWICMCLWYLHVQCLVESCCCRWDSKDFVRPIFLCTLSGLSGQLLIYNWNYGELSMLEISIVILLILCHIIIILLVLRSQYLFTFSYIVLILAWVIMLGLVKGVNGLLEALGVMWTNFYLGMKFSFLFPFLW